MNKIDEGPRLAPALFHPEVRKLLADFKSSVIKPANPERMFDTSLLRSAAGLALYSFFETPASDVEV